AVPLGRSCAPAVSHSSPGNCPSGHLVISIGGHRHLSRDLYARSLYGVDLLRTDGPGTYSATQASKLPSVVSHLGVSDFSRVVRAGLLAHSCESDSVRPTRERNRTRNSRSWFTGILCVGQTSTGGFVSKSVNQISK